MHMTLADERDRRRAAEDLETNLVVTAGAGTGKTSLLVERMLHHLLRRGTPLERLVAITFTRKAAAELRDRLEEALSGALEIAAGRREPRPEHEAGRFFARLPESAWPEAGRLAAQALEGLDGARIGTIHSFAADLLRRYHREAGVDARFTTDEDGAAAEELFAARWPAFLEEELALPGRREAWRRVLSKLSPEEVAGIARRLVEFRIPLEAVGPGAAGGQLAALRELGAGGLEEIARVRAALRGVAGINRNLARRLGDLEGLYREAAAGEIPAGAATLKDPPGLGTRAELDDAARAELEESLKALHRDVRSLAEADLELAGELGEALRGFVEIWRREALRRGIVSHDASIVLSRDLLRDHQEVRFAEGERIDHLLVDEFQDTDPLQYEIVFFLAQEPADDDARAGRDAYQVPLRPGKLFIVGDAKQSIYRFRGADIDAYRRAVETVRRQGGEVLTLTTNFRSRPEVIEPLNRLFAALFASGAASASVRDPDFAPLRAWRRPRGAPGVEVWSAGAPGQKAEERRRAEAEAIASWLRESTDRGEFRPGEAAILFRALTEVDIYLRALRSWGLSYVVEGGRHFYERYEVELLVALLRWLVHPSDEVSLVACLRSPLGAVPDRELQEYARARDRVAWSRGPGAAGGEFPALERALSRLHEFARRHRGAPLDLAARAALDDLGLRLLMAASYDGAQRVANIEKAAARIAELAASGARAPDEILAQLEREGASQAREGDSPLADDAVDAVKVVTIHKAKGLEWPVVILPDLAREESASGERGGPAVEVLAGGVGGERLAGGASGGGRSLPRRPWPSRPAGAARPPGSPARPSRGRTAAPRRSASSTSPRPEPASASSSVPAGLGEKRSASRPSRPGGTGSGTGGFRRPASLQAARCATC